MPTDPSDAAKLLGSRGGRKASEAQRAARSRNASRMVAANLEAKIAAALGDSIARCEVSRDERRVWLVLDFVPHDSLGYLERLSETMIAGGLLPNGWTVGLTKENA